MHVLFFSTGWILLQHSADLISNCRRRSFQKLQRFWAPFVHPDFEIGYGWKYPSVRLPSQRLACCQLLYYVGSSAFDGWQGTARSVWIVTSQLLAAVAAIRISIVTGNRTARGDGVLEVGNMLDWLYLSFFLLGVGLLARQIYGNMLKEGDSVFISVTELNLWCHIDFFNPQRNNVAIGVVIKLCRWWLA